MITLQTKIKSLNKFTEGVYKMEKFIKKYANMKTVFYILLGLLILFMWKNPEMTLMLFVSLVFASSLNPLVDKLNKKINRTAATSIVLFGSIGLLALFIIPIFALCIYQIGLFAKEFPQYINNINQIVHTYPIIHKLGIMNIKFADVFTQAANYSSSFIDAVMSLLGKLSSLSLYFLLTVIFTFFLLVDKDYIRNSILKFFPSSLRNKTNGIIKIVSQRIGGYVIAQTCAITSVGIIMIIGLWLFKIPYALLLGLITAVLDIIPVVGPAIGLIICLVATYEVGIRALLVVTLVFVIAQFVENNFVRPYAYGKLMNLHPMLIFIFLFLGTKYFGLVGTLFAPAIAATVCVLVEELYIKNLK